ncbi:hypothetical protein ACIQVL_26730 [Streptomyces sp. NPDC090499]|uniref:hypothetical protein n=1 Tax=unclassified Streptomyces TaxID=2593676 RepID=UPI0037FF4CC8
MGWTTALERHGDRPPVRSPGDLTAAVALTAAQLTGVWRDGHGAELRLRADGSAEAVALPAEPAPSADGSSVYAVCEGPGTWAPRKSWRDGVLLELDGDCGDDTQWSIGGSADAPQLFVVFGDPDAGTLRILRRTTTG